MTFESFLSSKNSFRTFRKFKKIHRLKILIWIFEKKNE
jgi:hypothetical protein